MLHNPFPNHGEDRGVQCCLSGQTTDQINEEGAFFAPETNVPETTASQLFEGYIVLSIPGVFVRWLLKENIDEESTTKDITSIKEEDRLLETI